MAVTATLSKAMCSTELPHVYHKTLLWILLIVGVILSPIATKSFMAAKQAEDGNEFLQKIIIATRTTSYPVIITDGHMNILHCNNAAARFVGITKEELRNSNAEALIPREYLKEHIEATSRLKVGSVGEADNFCEMRLADGTLRFIAFHVDYAVNALGNRIYIVTWDDSS